MPTGKPHHDYAEAYERHAREQGDPRAAVGTGDFERIGRLELSVLELEGLVSGSSLLDFGCGAGRLAVHAIPYLRTGRYVGIDISRTMIENARLAVGNRLASTGASDYLFDVNDGEDIDGFGADFDFICAFSVFTHLENEDTFRYMSRLLPLLKPGGKLVCSFLALETNMGKHFFLAEASLPSAQRWQRVRNFATTHSMAETIAELAGFVERRWYSGSEHCIPLDGTLHKFGQSILVALRPLPAKGATPRADELSKP